MTKQELNRDIKRLNSAYLACRELSGDDYYNRKDELMKEYVRLYNADTTFNSLTANSLRILIRLNLIFRCIQPHTFGINIELLDHA